MIINLQFQEALWHRSQAKNWAGLYWTVYLIFLPGCLSTECSFSISPFFAHFCNFCCLAVPVQTSLTYIIITIIIICARATINHLRTSLLAADRWQKLGPCWSKPRVYHGQHGGRFLDSEIILDSLGCCTTASYSVHHPEVVGSNPTFRLF